MNKKLIEDALKEAQAALWDAHYGCGISVPYVQSVDAKIRAALVDIGELTATGEEWSE